MGTIYVRTTGNDTTGTGATGTPYASLKKALSVAVAGDDILLGDGTYVEDSGSGYLNVTQSFASRVSVSPESGVAGTAKIKGAGTAYAVIFNNADYLWFDQITFESQAATNVAAVRFAGATETNLTFTRCKFTAYSSNVATNCAVKGTWSGADIAADSITFESCTFDQIGIGNAAGLWLEVAPSNGVGAANNVRVSGCDFRTSGRSMNLIGCTNVRITDNRCTAWLPSSAQTVFSLGVDAATGRACSGVITGNTFRALRGHGMVIGAGCDGVLVVDNRVYGGADATNGQGLVVKEAVNVRLERNTISSGYRSGLYFKAATDCQAIDNIIFNEHDNSSAVKVAVNSEDSSASSGIVVRRNYVHAIKGKVLEWEPASGDSGGSVCDENVYVVKGTATLGTVRGTTVTSLSAARAAWAGYNRAGNDRNSRIGQTGVTFAGARVIDLP